MKTLGKTILLTSIILLTACGGGGSSDAKGNEDNEIVPTFGFELSATKILLAENSFNSSIVISASNGNGAIYSFESSDASVSVSKEQSALKIISSETDRNKTVKVKVTGKLGSQIVEKNISIEIENTSGIKVVDYAEEIVENSGHLSNFNETGEIIGFMSELGEFSGRINPSESDFAVRSYNEEVEKQTVIVRTHIKELNDRIKSYSSGELSDTELENSINESMTKISSSHSSVLQVANELMEKMDLDKSISAIALAKIENGKNIGYSIFVGNEDLGEYKQGVWNFSGKHKYLNEVLSTSQMPKMCGV